MAAGLGLGVALVLCCVYAALSRRAGVGPEADGSPSVTRHREPLPGMRVRGSSLRLHGSTVERLQFSRDGRTLLAVGQGGEVSVIALGPGGPRQSAQILLGEQSHVTYADGIDSVVAASPSTGVITVYTAEGERRCRVLHPSGRVAGVWWDEAGGELMAYGGPVLMAYRFGRDGLSGSWRRLPALPQSMAAAIGCKTLLVGVRGAGPESAAVLAIQEDGEAQGLADGLPSPVTRFLDTSGDRYVAALDDGDVLIGAAAKGEGGRPLYVSCWNDVACLSPEGRHLVVASTPWNLDVLSLPSLERLARVRLPWEVASVAVCPRGTCCAVGYPGGRIGLYPLRDMRFVAAADIAGEAGGDDGDE